MEKEKQKDTSDGNLDEIRNLFISINPDKEKKLGLLLDARVKQILSLQENWDEEGAEKFSKDTLERVCSLLKAVFQDLWNEMIDIPFPLIQPVPDGSIDINWETENFELLVNIPSTPDELVNFYGEKIDHPENEIEVRINYNLITQSIIPWLIKVNA